MKKRCFNGILLLLFVCNVSAQKPLFRTFSNKDGFKTYNASKIIQDKYGFVWVLTQDGLYRYNGRTFDILKGTNNLSSGSIGNVFLDGFCKDENIYLADYNSGVQILNVSSLVVKQHVGVDNDSLSKKLPNYWIQKIFIDTLGNSWIGGIDFLAVKRKNESSFKIINEIVGFNKTVKVNNISQLGSNLVAIGVEGIGTLIYNCNSLELVTVINTDNNQVTHSIIDIIQEGDKLWMLAGNRIYYGDITSSGWNIVGNYVYSANTNVLPYCFVKQGQSFWVGSNTGLYKLNTLSRQKWHYTSADGLTANTINHLMIDKEQNLWIATSGKLQMLPMEPSVFIAYTGEANKGDVMPHVYQLSAKNNSEIFATGTEGLYVTNIEKRLTTKVKGTDQLGAVHCVINISNDLWVLSTEKGMVAYTSSNGLLSQETFLSKFPEWKTRVQKYYNKAIKFHNKIYWASEENEGVVVWDREKREITSYSPLTHVSKGISEGHIRNLKLDKKGHLWVLADSKAFEFDMITDSVINILDFSTINSPNKVSLIFDMLDGGDKLWFGSYGAGIIGYTKANGVWDIIDEKDGLCNNCVYSILPANDSVFWVSTNFGLSQVNWRSKNCINYYAEEGLQDNSFDEQSALVLNNKLYFGGVNGFTEVDFKRIENEKPLHFPVYIYKVEFSSTGSTTVLNNLSFQKLNLPPATNSINVYLAALTTRQNGKINFYYKIKETGDEFIPVLNNNFISLAGLGKGVYSLVIRYNDETGRMHELPSDLIIEILPKWYQTWWFKLLVLAATAGIIYAFYRYRIRQIKKQHEIRKNIATDLHDDLGSTLNSVKVFTNLAISGVRQEESLQQVKDNLTEATMSLRDMIWVLDDSMDTVDELVTRIKQFALPVAQASNIEAVITASSDANNRTLTKEEKRNLFLICKEAINNAIKYSGGSQITVNIEPAGKKIQITIADNGIGFDEATVKKGYGLKNMQYRAKQINFTVNVQSQKQQGTVITASPL